MKNVLEEIVPNIILFSCLGPVWSTCSWETGEKRVFQHYAHKTPGTPFCFNFCTEKKTNNLTNQDSQEPKILQHVVPDSSCSHSPFELWEKVHVPLVWF